MLAEGDPVPDVTLTGMDGEPVSPADFKRQQARPLFLSEGRHVRLHPRGAGFHRAGRRVREGRDLDPRRLQGQPESHAKFTGKYGLKVKLASDLDGSVCEAFGTWGEKSLYGRKYMGIDRATFLIDRDGTVARVWRKVKVPGHAEEVLAAARELP